MRLVRRFRQAESSRGDVEGAVGRQAPVPIGRPMAAGFPTLLRKPLLLSVHALIGQSHLLKPQRVKCSSTSSLVA